MIRIISDSTCDLSPELVEKYNIAILPLHVILGEDEYLDGVNISPEELFNWSDANKTTPKTSAPSIEDAVKLFKPIIENGDEIISFSISSDMSTSNNCMHIAAAELDAEDRISVIDSANLSTGIGQLVVEAAILASQGMTREEIVCEIEKLIPMVRSSFVVDTLTYLHRGGRCSGLAAMAGGMLKLHPRIYVENGKMDAGKKYRGKYSEIIVQYAKDMEESLLHARKNRIFITHSGIEQSTIDSVKQYLESLNKFDEIHVTHTGSVVSSHCGPGTLGVLFIAE